VSPPARAPPTPASAAVGRRRLLAGGAALGIALLGTGLLRPSTGAPATTTARTDAGTDDRRRDLRVGLRDERRPPDDPPAGAGPGDEGPTARSRSSPPSAATAGATADADGSSVAVDTGDGTVRVTTPDLSLAGLEPGDAGVVTADLDLAGGPAALRLATAVTGSEAGLTEPERVAGDDATAGELAAALRVVLTVEPAGGPARTLYEGSLAGLGALPDGVRLAACAAPGRHRVRLSWLVPVDATNAIASDVATVALGFLATDCGAPAPTGA
jgi:hypothetical protein